MLPLPASVAEALAAHLAEFGEGPSSAVFTTSTGRDDRPADVAGAFRSPLSGWGSGFDSRPPPLLGVAADLIGMLASCGGGFLGHKNAAETLNTYADLWPNDEGRITTAIDAGLPRDVHEMCTERATGG